MTKARVPNTFPDAITRIADRIGWAAMLEVVEGATSERGVRNWGDPDMNRSPTLRDALALDAAFLAAGGGEPPLLAVYQLLLERSVQVPADCAALASVGGELAKEAGEGLQAMFRAAQPGATVQDRAVAERELSDLAEVVGKGLRVLGASSNVSTLKVAS